MHILNEENKIFDLNLIPDEVDLSFWIFDNSVGMKDYFCQPLLMVESFYSPVVRLKLTVESSREKSQHYINLPADFQILIGEPGYPSLEIVPITSLSGRHFRAFTINPSTSFRPEFMHIEVDDVFPNSRKWFVPRLAAGQLHGVPLHSLEKPPCIFITRDLPKALEIINLKDAM